MPLRALHVLPRVIDESSGPSHTVPSLCKALSGKGLEVQLMVLEPMPDRALPFPATAYPTLPFPGCYRLGVSPKMASAIRRAASHVDVIHNHSLWMMPNIYPGPAARRAGCKLVISPRGTLEPWAWQRSRWRKALVWRTGQQSTLLTAHLLHATAASEYESIRAQGLMQPVAVIPNGVEIPGEVTPRQVGVSRTLLYLSRIHPKKQVERLLHAWSRIEAAFPDWRVTVAGPLDTPYADGVVRLARELRLPRIDFPGELGGIAKWRILCGADLFVLPTRSENFGLAIAEALAAGAPVVTTRGAPWAGLHEHGCGWWIEDNQDALEATLRRAMGTSRAELGAMGQRGRAWMETEFSWDGVAVKMAASYRWLLGRGDRPAWIVD